MLIINILIISENIVLQKRLFNRYINLMFSIHFICVNSHKL